MLISLRIPDDLLAAVDGLAQSDGRSRNSFVVRTLRGAIHGNGRIDEQHASATPSGSGHRTELPVLPEAKGRKKQLHPVQPLRRELAGRRDAPAELPQRGSEGGSPDRCPHGKLNEAYCRAIQGGC